MPYIPPDKPFSPPPVDPGTTDDTTTSKTGKVAQGRFTPTSDSTRSTAPLDITNSDRSKTTETTDHFATFILLPRSIEQLRKLAIYGPNPSKSRREQDIVSFLKTLKRPYPSRAVFQRMIKEIKNVDTLLEIWSALNLKPEDDSLEDLLVNVFQAIYAKNRDSSFTAYTKTGQRLKIKKRIADCIKPEDSEFFLDKAIDTNAHFSIVLFLKKFVMKKKAPEENWDFLTKFFKHTSELKPGELICQALLQIHCINPIPHLDYLSLHMFQHLCVDYFEAGWGKKEEFLTKALCSFWNEITSSNREEIKIDLESLENGILDIGVSHDSTLTSGNIPLVVLLFSVGILYPKVQKEIRAIENSPLEFKPEDFDSDIAGLDSKSKGFFNKIRTLLLPFEEAIKNLEEVDPLDPESFPCIRAKHPQFSGSCTVKNFNSLLSMSSLAPSIIMMGGFVHHSVYAEVFRLGDQYFALVHNLGAGGECHLVDERNKILPLALYFENKDLLMAFSFHFCNTTGSERYYLDLVELYALNSRNKNIEKELDRLQHTSSSIPFARSLVYPDKGRTSPMYPEYRKFRELQREIIRKLIDHTGSRSAVKDAASTKRKGQKGG